MSDAFSYLQYAFLNANVRTWPYSHFYLENVFPEGFYKRVLASLPLEPDYSKGKSVYHGRKFADPTVSGLFEFMLTEKFAKLVISTFLPDFQKRFPTGTFEPELDLRLVLDSENYSIGPHTDAAWKVVSLLFYLPPDRSLSDLGTSIYTPKDASFRCPGGPHHPHDRFNKVWTAPFLPNSCFGFFKTDNSFHGVDPIPRPCRRDVLLWNLYDKALKG